MEKPTTTTISKLAAGAGSASGEDAAQLAAAEALRAVDGEAGLLLTFPSGLDPDRAAAQTAAAAPGVRVAGMTGNGSIGPDGAIETGCSALALSARTPVGVGTARGAGRALDRAAKRATAEALHALGGSGNPTVLLFLDTRSGDQAEAVAGAYSAAGPQIPLVGGGAGGADPAQFAGGLACKDTVVAVAVGTPDPAGIGHAHGCRQRGTPAIATRSDGRILFELDGRPATEVYLEQLGYAGVELGRDDFEALAVTHPLAQPELSGDSRLRHVLGRTADGGLECATHIPANAAIEFTHQTPEDIVAASSRAVRMSLERLPQPTPSAALIFDCAGRKRAVAGALEQQVAGLLEGFGPDRPPLAGLFSHGEICRLRGAKGDRNHAVVVASFA